MTLPFPFINCDYIFGKLSLAYHLTQVFLIRFVCMNENMANKHLKLLWFCVKILVQNSSQSSHVFLKSHSSSCQGLTEEER